MKGLISILLIIILLTIPAGCAPARESFTLGPTKTAAPEPPRTEPIATPRPSPNDTKLDPGAVTISDDDTMEALLYRRGVGTIAGRVLSPEEGNNIYPIQARFLELLETRVFSQSVRSNLRIRFTGEVPLAVKCYEYEIDPKNQAVGGDADGTYAIKADDDEWPSFTLDMEPYDPYDILDSDATRPFRVHRCFRIVCEYESKAVEYLLIAQARAAERVATMKDGRSEVGYVFAYETHQDAGMLIDSDGLNDFDSIKGRFMERLREGQYTPAFSSIEFADKIPLAVREYVYHITPSGDFIHRSAEDMAAHEGAAARVLGGVDGLSDFQPLPLTGLWTQDPAVHRGVRIVCEYEDSAVEYLYLFDMPMVNGLVTITDGQAEVHTRDPEERHPVFNRTALSSDELNEFSSIQDRLLKLLENREFVLFVNSLTDYKMYVRFADEVPQELTWHPYYITAEGDFVYRSAEDIAAREGAALRVVEDVGEKTTLDRIAIEVGPYPSDSRDIIYKCIRLVCRYEDSAVEYLFIDWSYEFYGGAV